MTRPGTVVEVVDQTLPRSVPTRTDAWFITGFTEKGPVGEAIKVRSMERLIALTGNRVAYGYVYDAAETFFREGGSLIYLSRVVGPTPVKASAKLFDQAGSADPADVALVATAKNPGGWENGLNVEVTVSGADFRILVTHDVDGLLEDSGLLADRAAAVTWASSISELIDLTLGASNEDPRAQGPTSLAGGTDDHSNAVDAQWAAALTAFGKDLGPGQVSAPGRTTSTAHGQVLDHAAANNRVGLLDAPDTAVVATLTALASADQALLNAKYGQLLAPWAVIPGNVPGTTRIVPYSAIQAGLNARNDATLSPNVAAAGDRGISRFAIGLTQAWTDAQRETLNDGAVTIAIEKFGRLGTYGLRSVADPDTTPLWVQFPGARLIMAIKAKSEAVAEHYLFEQIDGRGLVFSKFASDLEGVLLPYYTAGSLFGATPSEAFIVDTGPQVNTEESIAAGEIRAAIGVRTSPGAELVYIQIARQAVDQPL